MGVCLPKELRDQTKANQIISNELKKEKIEQQCGHLKLLLLGTGESGKSTILKQMQILHKNGFTPAQLHEFKELIYGNTVECMAVLVAALERGEDRLDDPELEVDCKLVQSSAESGERHHSLSPELYLALKRLWDDKGIRRSFESRHRLQLPDCAKHFLDSLDRLNRVDFEPSHEDILFTRVATTGVVEMSFNAHRKLFHVFDVGGQRSERRKWIHIFDNVNAVIFVTAVSEYDKMMREDENKNRLLDSLQLFAATCNSEYFFDTTFILFLNKKDLFAAKIQTVPMTVVFPDFTGGQNYETSIEFIKGKYNDLNVNVDKILITHETCATDTNQVQHVTDGVFDTILAKSITGTVLV